MSDIPSELRYTKSHEWVQINDDYNITIGITDHAQELLGDLVFIELPSEGDELAAEDACVVVESVKAASDVYAPVAGEVVAVNTALDDAPELVNSDPYGEGWLFKLKVADSSVVESLLDADAYGAEAVE